MKYIDPKDIFKVPGARRGLPAWAYNNDELTQLEIDEVFLQNWLFVAHVAQIPNNGDYHCFEMGNERAIVVRDDKGEIRAFRNMCRHRASRVVSEQSGHCARAFICPFHGWSYNLDGSLRNIPKAESFPEINRAEFGLKTLDLEIWHGMIFIRFGGNGPSLADLWTEAEEEIGLYRIEDMEILNPTYDFKFDLDWKAVVDVDNEGYHVPIGHPELFDLVGGTYRDGQLESGLSRSTGCFGSRKHKLDRNRDYVAALPADSYLPESHRDLWIYYGLYPTFTLTLFPDQVEVYQFLPQGPQKSIMKGMTFALPDDRPEMQRARQLNQEINMEVGQEDFQLIEWVAEGMRSKAFDGLMLSDREVGVAAFHNKLREVLPILSLDQAPEAGSLAELNAQMLSRTNVAAAG